MATNLGASKPETHMKEAGRVRGGGRISPPPLTLIISDATVTKLLTNSMQDLKMNNLETKKCNNFVFWVLVSVFKCVLKLPA